MSEASFSIDDLIEIAVTAGEEILTIYAQDFSVANKQDDSPLTAADLAAHHSIVAGLNALTPDYPVLSEESAALPYSERQHWQRYWLVDPLDGTKEFINRNGEFTVNIALIDQGQAVCGVVHVPVSGVTYAGEKNTGAFKREDGRNTMIHVTRPTAKPVRVVGSRSHAGDSLQALLGKLGEHELVSMGSSLKLCLIAEGKADFYPRLGPTSEWDTAAAQAVVEAAGGQVVTLDGKPLRYNTKDTLLNPHFLVFGDEQIRWLDFL
jgi:3'(2'), 5'-bisphosphate nucleotidase